MNFALVKDQARRERVLRRLYDERSPAYRAAVNDRETRVYANDSVAFALAAHPRMRATVLVGVPWNISPGVEASILEHARNRLFFGTVVLVRTEAVGERSAFFEAALPTPFLLISRSAHACPVARDACDNLFNVFGEPLDGCMRTRLARTPLTVSWWHWLTSWRRPRADFQTTRDVTVYEYLGVTPQQLLDVVVAKNADVQERVKCTLTRDAVLFQAPDEPIVDRATFKRISDEV